MTSLVFIHGLDHTPLAWRGVADRISIRWPLAAPNLAACESVQDMLTTIDADLRGIGSADDDLFIVAEGAGAIPALRYAEANPERVRALFLTGPIYWLTTTQTRLAKMRSAFGGGAEKVPVQLSSVNADPAAVAQLTAALCGEDVGAIAAKGIEGVHLHVAVAENDRRSRKQADRIAKKYGIPGEALAENAGLPVSPFVIAEAEADWFDYAPDTFTSYMAAIAAMVDIELFGA